MLIESVILVTSFSLIPHCQPYNLYCVGGDVKHCTIQSNQSYPSRCCREICLCRSHMICLQQLNSSFSIQQFWYMWLLRKAQCVTVSIKY